jgi:hypothetical protein
LDFCIPFYRLARHPHRARDVDIQQFRERLVLQCLRALELGNARRIDQHLDRAPFPFDRIECGGYGCSVANIAIEMQHVFHRLRRLGEAGPRHLRAARSQQRREMRPQPR